MLLGIWKNIEELEDSINIDELHMILKAGRDREERQNRFAAALKGINLDEGKEDEAYAAVERRAKARLEGRTEEELEFEELGIEVEVED